MADQPLLLALDQGTSSSRAAVFDAKGGLVASATAPLPIQYPADGWVEHIQATSGTANERRCRICTSSSLKSNGGRW